ncbi:calcineurin-like phosphoesterase C-terminal domain-containing protein [Alistipes senegalensis]|uniref:calcineurin-like phosphoesterase C-terminal domain-containing protein n=1 Tax=Alistipes senegalensis TaxID=1288121 RepID=UPI0024303BCC|nr:calcineurin-like phosphoesterase C-terminal domain-containing protein [Alistipes senegalensis]MDY4571084.1 calcineurin-like phosphoesterase C-terminal domain-containing protein [Alistipes senegalensis]
MKRLILTLLSTAAAVTLAAQPDSLDYRGDYYFSKRSQQESLPVRPHHTVMLGNSLTERGAWAEYFPEAHVINRGIGGDCVAGMAARLDSIVAGRPRAIFLMAGVNDLIFSTIAPEALLRQYERLLDRIATESPATQVFIQSPLPLDEARNEPYFTGKNARIEAFDRLLRRMAARRGLKFIDIRSRMLRDGKLPAEYTVDGIHLTPAGYAVWIEALRPYVTPAGARIGTVTCAGRGLAGVVVSDGDNCAATDSAGRFVLPANDRARFVFVSTPAGYASPSEEGVVRHYLPAKSDGSSHDFRLRRKPSGETRHGFVVVADPQLFARKEFRLLERAAEDIRQTAAAAERSGRPMHGICAGDITSGDHTFYTSYNEVMSATGIEFRNAMGNHDMKLWGRSHETSAAAFEAMYGPAYYSYNVGEVHYAVLNDNYYIGRDWYYIGYLEERQLAWLERDLSFVPAGTTVVVALHIPTAFAGKDEKPFDYPQAERSLCNHRALHRLLEPYDAHVVSGHMHTTTNCPVREGLYEHNVAALSGAWWQGAICTDGTPAGYAVFEVDGGEVTWYYKSVGHPRSFQLKIYDSKDDEAFAGRVVANVWNCDPAWTVEMHADGGRPVRMERTTAVDPQARRLYADASKLDHKWITVTPSDHYYAAPLPAGTRRVEVTARDRFGNTYRAEKRINR